MGGEWWCLGGSGGEHTTGQVSQWLVHEEFDGATPFSPLEFDGATPFSPSEFDGAMPFSPSEFEARSSIEIRKNDVFLAIGARIIDDFIFFFSLQICS